MSDLAIGVIGTGGMGTRHAHNVHRQVAGARLAGLYDLDQQRAQQVAAACGEARVFRDPVELIQDAGIDAVVIASPDPTHAHFVNECLRAHKPVLCEKPLATTVNDAQAIILSEQSLGRRLIAVGFNRRFDPQHLAVRKLVDSGQIGRAILFKGVHRNPMIPSHRPGAVVVTNSAIHDIDAPRWLLGQEITEVFARGVRTHSSFSDETQDMLLLHMTLSGHCLATIECSVAVEYGYEVSAEIVGERGTVMTLQPDMAVVRANQARIVPVSDDGIGRFQEAYVAELTHWTHALQTGQPFPGADAWDGYMAVLVAEACIRSLQTGAPIPVAIPEKPPLYGQRSL